MSERAKLLRKCIQHSVQVAEGLAKAAEVAKGSYGTGLGDELLVWASVTWGFREYAESLEAGARPPAFSQRQGINGQPIMHLFPQKLDALVFGGLKGELWIQPGKPATQGATYRAKHDGQPGKGSVALVLGAGNQASVVCFDILHMLIVDDAVVICKINPVNDYIGPFIREAFFPFVEAGFLEIVYGGPAEGKFLSEHKAVSAVHLTGSASTYDAIVWGKQPKVKGKAPPCTKRVTAELGCITPYIIVPGEWTQSDMEYYANEIVAGLVNNSGHNCTKVEVLVTDAAWPQREAFQAVLRDRLDQEQQRVAWYPGSDERVAAAKKRIPNLQELGRPAVPESVASTTASSQPNGHPDPTCSSQTSPWLLSTGLTPEQASLQQETWVGVLQELALPGLDGSVTSFLKAAPEFCNRECWGNLSAAMFVPPAVMKAHPTQVEQAIADLQYGAVTVNVPSFFVFAVPTLAWGAFPGNQPHDISSGNCFVHNVQLYDHVQKSVLWAPWRMYPTHFYDTRNRNLPALAKAVMHYSAAPGLLAMTVAASAAVRG